jgi:ribonuclease P protein component
MPDEQPPHRYTFPRSHRLSGSPAFDRVFDAQMRKNAGPLIVFTLPNGLPHSRLGLSVSRRVGTAVKRNRIKRYIREAFRLSQHDWPLGYDVVVVVRPHDTGTLADYQKVLFNGIRSGHLNWQRRTSRQGDETAT